VEGFLRFADFFFDGLFSSWAVLDQISTTQAQIQRTQTQIETVLGKLKSALSNTRTEKNHLLSRIDTLVLEAQ
jgi:hypothetical protein